MRIALAWRGGQRFVKSLWRMEAITLARSYALAVKYALRRDLMLGEAWEAHSFRASVVLVKPSRQNCQLAPSGGS